MANHPNRSQGPGFFNVYDVRYPGRAALVHADGPEAAVDYWRRNFEAPADVEVRAKRTTDRRNILITRLAPAPNAGGLGPQPDPGHYVEVRWGWSAIGADEAIADGRPTYKFFVAWKSYDPAARNAVGGLGAVIRHPDADAIRVFVAELLSVWGALPVQDNSGAFPDISTGPFDG